MNAPKTRTIKEEALIKRQAVLDALPGTAPQIAERTKLNVNAVWHHIYTLMDQRLVERAGRIRTPTPAARFRTAIVYCKIGERPVLPPLEPVEKAKPKPRPNRNRPSRSKNPPKPPKAEPKVWVIDTPHRTIWAGPHPYFKDQA